MIDSKRWTELPPPPTNGIACPATVPFPSSQFPLDSEIQVIQIQELTIACLYNLIEQPFTLLAGLTSLQPEFMRRSLPSPTLKNEATSQVVKDLSLPKHIYAYRGKLESFQELAKDKEAHSFFAQWRMLLFSHIHGQNPFPCRKPIRQLVKEIKALNPKASIYVPIAFNRTSPQIGLDKILQQIKQWKSTGIAGFYLDRPEREAEFSLVTLQGILQGIHDAKLKVVLSVGDDVDLLGFNDKPLMKKDFILLEDLVVNEKTYQEGHADAIQIKSRLDRAASYQDKYGVKVLATGLVDTTYPFEEMSKHFKGQQSIIKAYGLRSSGFHDEPADPYFDSNLVYESLDVMSRNLSNIDWNDYSFQEIECEEEEQVHEADPELEQEALSALRGKQSIFQNFAENMETYIIEEAPAEEEESIPVEEVAEPQIVMETDPELEREALESLRKECGHFDELYKGLEKQSLDDLVSSPVHELSHSAEIDIELEEEALRNLRQRRGSVAKKSEGLSKRAKSSLERIQEAELTQKRELEKLQQELEQEALESFRKTSAPISPKKLNLDAYALEAPEEKIEEEFPHEEEHEEFDFDVDALCDEILGSRPQAELLLKGTASRLERFVARYQTEDQEQDAAPKKFWFEEEEHSLDITEESEIEVSDSQDSSGTTISSVTVNDEDWNLLPFNSTGIVNSESVATTSCISSDNDPAPISQESFLSNKEPVLGVQTTVPIKGKALSLQDLFLAQEGVSPQPVKKVKKEAPAFHLQKLTWNTSSFQHALCSLVMKGGFFWDIPTCQSQGCGTSAVYVSTGRKKGIFFTLWDPKVRIRQGNFSGMSLFKSYPGSLKFDLDKTFHYHHFHKATTILCGPLRSFIYRYTSKPTDKERVQDKTFNISGSPLQMEAKSTHNIIVSEKGDEGFMKDKRFNLSISSIGKEAEEEEDVEEESIVGISEPEVISDVVEEDEGSSEGAIEEGAKILSAISKRVKGTSFYHGESTQESVEVDPKQVTKFKTVAEALVKQKEVVEEDSEDSFGSAPQKEEDLSSFFDFLSIFKRKN